MKKHLAIMLLAALSSLSAFADPSAWAHFTGEYKVLQVADSQANAVWLNLESRDNDFCGGRIRAYVADYYNYRVDIEGSWCKQMVFGYNTSGRKHKFLITPYDQSINLIYLNSSNSAAGTWEGYGGGITISASDVRSNLYDAGSEASLNSVNAVIFTDSRDDTHQSAYEKIRLQF
jgi:hypothetical protein